MLSLNRAEGNRKAGGGRKEGRMPTRGSRKGCENKYSYAGAPSEAPLLLSAKGYPRFNSSMFHSLAFLGFLRRRGVGIRTAEDLFVLEKGDAVPLYCDQLEL